MIDVDSAQLPSCLEHQVFAFGGFIDKVSVGNDPECIQITAKVDLLLVIVIVGQKLEDHELGAKLMQLARNILQW